VGEESLDLRGAHLTGVAFVVEEDEAGDPVHVGVFGVDGVVFLLQDSAHVVKQFLLGSFGHIAL
jgi:hypothetical protein